MAKTLVLAEKPSVARDIARTLKCNEKKNGYIEGKDYIVTWALGHLVGLADPEAYGNQYKTWSMETLPMLPKTMKLVVLKGGGKQYGIVKDLLHRKDVNAIIIATDAGREGELVARWIIEKAGIKKPMKRLWISSVTDKAIKEGFNNLKDARQYENLYHAAVCRAEGDWLVGLNVTRALTCKYNAQLSAGRVQSATLNMIVKREEAIKKFQPTPYYKIAAKSNNTVFRWTNGKSDTLKEISEAEKIVSKTQGANGRIVDVKTVPKKQYAPGLYDLTELQRDANKRYGLSPKETLNTMQRLYENHKVLTYPRTDSKYISQDIVQTIKERLQAVSFGAFKPSIATILRSGIKANKSFVDDTKVSDHHAIIPTEESVNLANLAQDERRIYEMVVKRFLSVLLPPCEYKQTTVTVDVAGETFRASGRQVIQEGFRVLYNQEHDDNDEQEEQKLPAYEKGATIKFGKIECETLMTKPPLRFTEATLLSAMESPHQYVTMDQKDAKMLGQTGGIGTVATRADIIEKLYKMFYIEKNGKSIVPTSKGKQLIELVPEDLKSPTLTAQWESQLEAISKGKVQAKDFVQKIRVYSEELVNAVKKSDDKFRHDNMTGKKCSECGKYMLEVKGKHGMMYVCQDRSCGHRENISKFTQTRCPNCHKRLELRGEGDGQIYVCTTCTYREKLSAFNKKHRTNNKKVDKKSVQTYLKSQQKEEEGNFAFADIFAKLKQDDKK
ncbi:MAG: DNA topoisomerase III [Cellulosilyticaceae bacterium]